MNDRGIRRWVLLGALASAALLTPGCWGQEAQEWPEANTDYEGIANESQDLESFGESRQDPQSATGGSGRPQQQPPQGETVSPLQPGQSQVPEHASGAQGVQDGIGAPGFSSPKENLEASDPRYDEPVRGESLDQKPRRQDVGQVEGGE